MKLNLFILIAVLITLYSCGVAANKYYTPTDANATKSKTSVENLIAGRTLYINNCGECHRLYKPSRNTTYEWRNYVDEMQEKAEITDKEKELIYTYLTAEIIE